MKTQYEINSILFNEIKKIYKFITILSLLIFVLSVIICVLILF